MVHKDLSRYRDKPVQLSKYCIFYSCWNCCAQINNCMHLVIWFNDILQALLPGFFQLLYIVFIIIIDIMETNTIPNIYIMITAWESSIHPIICFICVRHLRLSLHDLLAKFYCLLKFKKSIHPRANVIKVLPCSPHFQQN